MALYEVKRTDEIKPGEFDSAYVIAGGTAQARGMVKHMGGVTAKNVKATRIDVGKVTMVLSTYFDEREAH